MSFPRGAVAWSVSVAFSCASHVPWDQVSASGLLVVFCCRVAMLYVSSSRCRGLVCDFDIALCLSVPWDQISASGPLVVFCCRVAVLYVSSSQCRGLVCDVTFSCASHVPWDQVSPLGPLVVCCCCVAVSVICLFLAVPWLGL